MTENATTQTPDRGYITAGYRDCGKYVKEAEKAIRTTNGNCNSQILSVRTAFTTYTGTGYINIKKASSNYYTEHRTPLHRSRFRLKFQLLELMSLFIRSRASTANGTDDSYNYCADGTMKN